MIGFAAERLMELEEGAATGASFGEKTPSRLAQRNGYRDRDWETRAGTVELRASRSCGRVPVSRLFGAVPDGRKDPDGGDPGGLCSRHLDAIR